MKHVILAIFAFLMASPALAQVRLEFGPRGDGYYDNAPPPPYYRDRYRGGPPYGRGYDGYERPGRRAVGFTCYTSRGLCETPGPAPIGARCRCNIPGFGPKRGNVTR